ncbi:MAG: prepilin peptidase [Candidatus Paceibacterota bacterium]
MLELSLALLVFLFGLIVGSFLNVVILRYNTGRSFVGGRSICFACGKLIRWFENIPLISYILLKGVCRKCKSAISLQYPLIELVTGCVFLAVWLSFSAGYDLQAIDYVQFSTYVVLPVLFYFVAFSLLIVIFVYDLYHKIIPDVFSYSFALIALAGLLLTGEMSGFNPGFWLDLAAGPALFLPFWALWFFSGGTWMGLGDGKLALGIGWFLGLSAGVSAVILAFWIGAGVAILFLLFQKLGVTRLPFVEKHLTMSSEIPFGPFLVIGTILQFFLEFNLFVFPF